MAITDNAVHALLIDGEHVAGECMRTVIDPASGDEALRSPTVITGASRDSEIVEREAGTVWSIEHLASGSEMPRGGVKGSGFAKDMSMHAREESR